MTSSRREILKTAAAGSLGLTSFSAFAGIPVGCELKTPTKWDMTTEVVVAGSGAAGMAAAICAIEQGVKVDVFEKEKENYGGCAFICGGILNLQGGTRLQKRARRRRMCPPEKRHTPAKARRICQNRNSTGWVRSVERPVSQVP